ncbi:uncharacterized protein LOC124265164 [Haliotis rubra]|uniref:uncharacterized protein LOC124265164 n=1 Tax=Haliotis rubra TaxID=36100 RepID=UPI001EE55F11|nr:uncharacterized protein LOC124265164 [Haliotis rubra]XP_046555907.1 uncharacterized protein LOC124265164 [Haliotis rubra]XP_046555908.1 uncharacterized protein LOC124265164 [Haliotis rubra]XP_046555909.1 uncharacterized protein LOC124265164 [Haliotis rubra]
MDIQKRLQRKNHQAALQARRMNKTARRLLQDKIGILESSYKKQEKLLCRETKSLEQELRSCNGTTSTSLQHPATVHSLNHSPSQNIVSDLRVTPGCGSQCRFHAMPSQCRYFPCQRLSTYHSIGFNIRAPSGQSVEPGTSKAYIFLGGVALEEDNVVSSRDIGCLAPSTHVSPRNSIQDRERGLRQLVREMKQRNNQQRPRAWAVNYGNPMSSRQLLKPVVPVSDQELAP